MRSLDQRATSSLWAELVAEGTMVGEATVLGLDVGRSAGDEAPVIPGEPPVQDARMASAAMIPIVRMSRGARDRIGACTA